MWKRCFRDFIDFAAIARSAGAMVLRVRDRASLRLKNAARWFCSEKPPCIDIPKSESGPKTHRQIVRRETALPRR